MDFTESIRCKEIGLFIDQSKEIGEASKYWTWKDSKKVFDFQSFYFESFELCLNWVIQFELNSLLYFVRQISFRK